MSTDDPTPTGSGKSAAIKARYDTMLEAVKEKAEEVSARVKVLTDEIDTIQPGGTPTVPPETDAATSP